MYLCAFSPLFLCVSFNFSYSVFVLHCVIFLVLLQESQRMQTKLDALTREVFDLQETINWKDKKIGVGGPAALTAC